MFTTSPSRPCCHHADLTSFSERPVCEYNCFLLFFSKGRLGLGEMKCKVDSIFHPKNIWKDLKTHCWGMNKQTGNTGS